ncbi:hypothetical protein [Terriglobus roseus]|uniref:hypothetical protein n=1 Tax=Terriglobus roseus TaxID=392734 RepID=UPI0002DBF1BB|nr:hypothetical protein [Terriglobus roseus]
MKTLLKSLAGMSLALGCLTTSAQRTPAPAAANARYLYGRNQPVKVLRHVRIMDGTGGPVLQDQTIVIDNGTIRSIGADAAAPAGAEVFDLAGYTVLPGLVGMHDHIYYLQRPNSDAEGSEAPTLLPQMTFRRRACTWRMV